jgi:ATP-dependent protease ClpP protease subunit
MPNIVNYTPIQPLSFQYREEKKGTSKLSAESDTAIIDISGFIGTDFWTEWMTGEPSPNTSEQLKSKIKAINSDTIIVNINSLGGDLNDGLMIKAYLQQKKAKVITNTYGFCASAATVIAQAGTIRRMPSESFMLIHRVMFGLCGYYNQNTFKAMVEDCNTIDQTMIAMYEVNTGKKLNAQAVANLMDEGEGYGKWISAEQALEYGLIDEIFDPSNESDPFTDHLETVNSSTNKEQRMRNAENMLFFSNLKQNSLNREMLNHLLYQKEELPSHSVSAKDARTREIETINLIRL